MNKTRIFRILKWVCLVLTAVSLLPSLIALVLFHTAAPIEGVIGGADGPTTIIVSGGLGGGLWWLGPVVLLALGILFAILEKRSRR
jgi:Na+-transporting methylmalonyl-CoA/oxaloacetate decarboxylase beta subunit